MTRWIEMSAWVWLALAGLVLIRCVAFRRPRRGTKPCRGPGAEHGPGLLPWFWRSLSWLIPRYSSRCGYDLSASLPDPDWQVRCPECGASHTASARARPDRWVALLGRRLARNALPILILLTFATGSFFIRPILLCEWCSYTPSAVLVTLADDAPGRVGRVSREVMQGRLAQDLLSDRERHRLGRAAVRALRHDGKTGNGLWATSVLHDLGDAALPRLVAALDSKDYQQRQCAASILRDRWEDGWGLCSWRRTKTPWEAPDRLFEVSVEGLADDSMPFQFDPDVRYQRLYIANAYEGLMFLVENPDRSPPFLAPALDSADHQQRLLAAIAVAFCEATDLADRAVPILIENLASDERSGNAATSARALYLLGDAARPRLWAIVNSADEQQARLARLVLLDLQMPGAPRALRRLLNREVTMKVMDPATDLAIDDVRDLLSW